MSAPPAPPQRWTSEDPEPMEICEIERNDILPVTQPARRLQHATQPPPWATLNVTSATPTAHVEQYLSQFLPSQCTKAQVSWISIKRDDLSVGKDADPQTMVLEWQWLCDQGQASTDALHYLARKYNVLTGKWMVFGPTKNIDSVWRAIARAVAAKRLGPIAKVSPVSSPGAKEEHVICVYAANYFDREEVQRIRQHLKQLGHHDKLLFKPDAYTYCGIYSRNPWGIPEYAFSI